MSIHLRNNPTKFHRDPIWNCGAFLKMMMMSSDRPVPDLNKNLRLRLSHILIFTFTVHMQQCYKAG